MINSEFLLEFTDYCIAQINPDYSKFKVKIIANEIINCYSELHRVYHTLEHIEYGLKLLKEVKYLCQDYFLVQFAWWYHDVIYLPNSLNNESVSANKVAFDSLQLKFADDTTLKIYKMIMATKHLNNKAESNDEKIIHDVDLAILGSDKDEYLEYANAIRKEYLMYPAEKYNKGRVFILKNFLNLEKIYYTEYFQECYEKKARINILKEISNLLMLN